MNKFTPLTIFHFSFALKTYSNRKNAGEERKKFSHFLLIYQNLNRLEKDLKGFEKRMVMR